MLTYYSSDYEIGSTFQVMEQMEDHGDGGVHGDDQVFGLRKEEREKQNGLKAKVKFDRAICFGDRDT